MYAKVNDVAENFKEVLLFSERLNCKFICEMENQEIKHIYAWEQPVVKLNSEEFNYIHPLLLAIIDNA